MAGFASRAAARVSGYAPTPRTRDPALSRSPELTGQSTAGQHLGAFIICSAAIILVGGACSILHRRRLPCFRQQVLAERRISLLSQWDSGDEILSGCRCHRAPRWLATTVGPVFASPTRAPGSTCFMSGRCRILRAMASRFSEAQVSEEPSAMRHASPRSNGRGSSLFGRGLRRFDDLRGPGTERRRLQSAEALFQRGTSGRQHAAIRNAIRRCVARK